MKNNQIITEELRTIVALMSYDRSKTLIEQDPRFQRVDAAPADATSTDGYRQRQMVFMDDLKTPEQREQENIEAFLKMYTYNKEPKKVKLYNTSSGYWDAQGRIHHDGEQYWYLPYMSPRYEMMVSKGEIYDVKKYIKNGQYVDKYFAQDKYKEILEDIYNLDWQDWSALYGPKAQNADSHKLLGYAELILTGIGIIASIIAAIPSGGASLTATAGLVSTFALGAATIAGLSDAALYLSEGDTYSAFMAGALTLIPGDELFKILKRTGKLAGVSDDLLKGILNAPEEMLPIIKKARNGLDNLSPKELEKFLLFKRATLLNSAIIGKESIKYSIRAIKDTIKSLPFGKLAFKLANMSSGFIKAGGTAYAVDKIWLAYSVGESMSAEHRRKMRTYLLNIGGQEVNLGSDFGAIMDYAYDEGILATMRLIGTGLWSMIWGEDGEANEEGRKSLLNGMTQMIESLPEDEETLKKLEPTEEEAQAYKNELNKVKTAASSELKTLMSFRAGHDITVNMLKNGTGTIQRGDKGNSTKYVQELLSQIKNPAGEKYDLGTSGKNKNGVDADFGESTESAVILFQADYVFDPDTEKGKIDGIVGEETINKLEEVLEKQKNEEQ